MRVQTELFDGWTLLHTATGYAMAKAGVPEAVAVALAVLYEIVEQPVLASETGRNFFNASGPEGYGNQAVDVLVFWLGYRLAK